MLFTKPKPILFMAVVCVGVFISSQTVLAHGNSEPNNGTDSDMMRGQYGSDMMGGQCGSGMMNGQYGSGMMNGQYGSGMMSGLAMLDLTDEQVNKVTKEQDRLRKKAWEIMGLELDQQPILREALSADIPDPTTVGQAYGKIFELRRQMIEEKIISGNKIRSFLDKDQIRQLSKNWLHPENVKDNTRTKNGVGMDSSMMQTLKK